MVTIQKIADALNTTTEYLLGSSGTYVVEAHEKGGAKAAPFQEPYRMLCFADRTALSDYLMGKYDTSWGQDTASPFIMENDELMDGWRPNPDRGSSAID